MHLVLAAAGLLARVMNKKAVQSDEQGQIEMAVLQIKSVILKQWRFHFESGARLWRQSLRAVEGND